MVYEASRLNEYGASSAHPADRSGTGNATGRAGPIVGVTAGASSLLNDAFDLAELQAKLLNADAQECLRTAKSAIVGIVLALGLLIASLPVLASGLAQFVAWAFEWPLWTCQLLVGFGFTAVGAAISVWCVRMLKTSVKAFGPSQREVGENIKWLRQALSQSLVK